MNNSKCYYDILGVSKNASINDIKQAYRKKASIHHPDRGGKTEDFQLINDAHETLTNPHKREIYDKQINKNKFINNLLRTKLDVNIPLEFLYNGKKLSVNVIRNIGKENIHITIPPRSMNKYSKIIPGYGNVIDGINTDLEIIFTALEHPVYKLDKHGKLILEISVTIGDILCGFEKEFLYLDKEYIYIKSPPGNIVQLGDKYRIHNMGLNELFPLEIIINEIIYPTNNFLDDNMIKNISSYDDLKMIIDKKTDNNNNEENKRIYDLSKLDKVIIEENEKKKCLIC